MLDSLGRLTQAKHSVQYEETVYMLVLPVACARKANTGQM